MAEFPKVSVIVPAYNVAPYLAETLDSVLAQTWKDYELILVNDGSTDETPQLVASYRQRFADKLIYLEQPNQGLAAARNTGLRKARSPYIALLDGDDIWMPHYLETMLRVFEADATLDVVFPNALFWGSPKFDGMDFQSVFPPNPPITVEKIVSRESNVFGLATIRRELLLSVGGYDDTLRSSEDFDLWLRLLKRGSRFGYTTEALVKYRYRSDSLSNTGISHYHNKIKVLTKVLSSGNLSSHEKAAAQRELDDSQATLNWHLYRDKLQAQDYAGAAEHLKQANAHRHRLKWSLLRLGLRLAPQFTARFLTSNGDDELTAVNRNGFNPSPGN